MILSVILACLVSWLLCYLHHLNRRVTKLQLELFKYASHDYVVQRFSNVWSEIHHTQDAVSKLQSKRGNR